jgi:hypothetical protein
VDALLDQVKIYNPVSKELEVAYLDMLRREYATFCGAEEPVS